MCEHAFNSSISKNSFVLKKVGNEQKRMKTAEKKYFNQLLGVRSTQKLVKIHNTL